jgi:hypothetical protein
MTRRVTVLSPVGYPPKITGKRLAPPLDTLEGKVIALIDGKFDKASGMFMEEVAAWFAETMPTVSTQIFRWRNPVEDDPATSERVREHADAAILGVGI